MRPPEVRATAATRRIAGARAALALAAGASIGLWPLGAGGQAPPPAAERLLTLRAGTSALWDANVFRVADSVTDPLAGRGLAGRGDRVSTTYFGVTLDKSYAQQRVAFEVTETATRYDKFSLLDLDAFNYRGLIAWHLTPRVSGTLAAEHAESAVGFADTTALQRNTRSTDNRRATLDLNPFGGWHLLGALLDLRRKSTLPFAALPNIEQTTREAGVQYVAPSGSSITLTGRSGSGANSGQAVDLVNFVDSEFSTREAEVLVRWLASARSTVAARLTRIERRNPHVPQRDVSGTAGELNYAWTPTGRLAFNLVAKRDILPWTPDTTTSYRVDDSLLVTPTWNLSDKLTVRGIGSRVAVAFRGPVVPLAVPERRDVLHVLGLGLTWAPHRKISLSADVHREWRDSNDPTFQFKTTFLRLNAALTF